MGSNRDQKTTKRKTPVDDPVLNPRQAGPKNSRVFAAQLDRLHKENRSTYEQLLEGTGKETQHLQQAANALKSSLPCGSATAHDQSAQAHLQALHHTCNTPTSTLFVPPPPTRQNRSVSRSHQRVTPPSMPSFYPAQRERSFPEKITAYVQCVREDVKHPIRRVVGPILHGFAVEVDALHQKVIHPYQNLARPLAVFAYDALTCLATSPHMHEDPELRQFQARLNHLPSHVRMNDRITALKKWGDHYLKADIPERREMLIRLTTGYVLPTWVSRGLKTAYTAGYNKQTFGQWQTPPKFTFSKTHQLTERPDVRRVSLEEIRTGATNGSHFFAVLESGEVIIAHEYAKSPFKQVIVHPNGTRKVVTLQTIHAGHMTNFQPVYAAGKIYISEGRLTTFIAKDMSAFICETLKQFGDGKTGIYEHMLRSPHASNPAVKAHLSSLLENTPLMRIGFTNESIYHTTGRHIGPLAEHALKRFGLPEAAGQFSEAINPLKGKPIASIGNKVPAARLVTRPGFVDYAVGAAFFCVKPTQKKSAARKPASKSSFRIPIPLPFLFNGQAQAAFLKDKDISDDEGLAVLEKKTKEFCNRKEIRYDPSFWHKRKSHHPPGYRFCLPSQIMTDECALEFIVMLRSTGLCTTETTVYDEQVLSVTVVRKESNIGPRN